MFFPIFHQVPLTIEAEARLGSGALQPEPMSMSDGRSRCPLGSNGLRWAGDHSAARCVQDSAPLDTVTGPYSCYLSSYRVLGTCLLVRIWHPCTLSHGVIIVNLFRQLCVHGRSHPACQAWPQGKKQILCCEKTWRPGRFSTIPSSLTPLPRPNHI